jgi:uncharacterized membrane protein YgcG
MQHGIFRCIPLLHQEKASSIFKERYIDVAVTSVRMDDGGIPFTVDTSRTKTCIKIGDPDITITGKHLYEIGYTVAGALTYEDYGGVELYWNVTGHEWTISMQNVEAYVTSERSLMTRERSCYRGREGETDSCNTSIDEYGVVHFSSTNFSPHEGMTVAQALDRSKIAVDIRERFKMVWLLSIVGLILCVGVGYGIYRYKTRFKTNHTIIPQYEPYEGVKPMYMGVLFDGKLDSRDITAGIVYLAEQGFMKIRKTEKKTLFFFEVDEYEFTLLKPLSAVSNFEKGIAMLLFSNLESVGDTISLSTLKNNLATQKSNSKLLIQLKNDLEKDLVTSGFFQDTSSVFIACIVIAVFFTLLIHFVFSLLQSYIPVFFVVPILVGLSLQRRRTQKGYEALDYLKGFKEFLQVTESQRYIFHNAPERNAEQFMEYLPYAIAFGVEKEWAKTFEGITIPNPTWYDSGAGMHSFNALSLTQSLGAFSTAFAGAPGISASSGGGFSGGGSGGGGGGSW